MKYLVCGGCGFIGSTLVKKLMEDENEVGIIDDLSTGSLSNLLRSSLPYLGIVNKISDIEYFDKKNKIGGIFHLGIPCSSPLYRDDRSLVDKSIKEFIEIMEYAKVNKVKVVWASTSSIYNGNVSPYYEDMTIYPKDFYAEVRYTMERLAKVYYDFYKVRTIALRLFSVYGPNENSKGIYANLVSQIIWAKQKEESIDIYNNGKGSRDFIHVDDVVRMFIIAMNSDIDFDILNVGTGRGYEINQIIEAVGLKNFRYTDPPNITKNFKFPDTLADMEKTKRVLGFVAKVNVLDYLKNLQIKESA